VTNDTAAPVAEPRRRLPAVRSEGTGSRGSRVLGLVTLTGMGALLLFGLVLSPEDPGPSQMGDGVRIMYMHVPVAIIAGLAFGVTALGSAMYLWKRSEFWDLTAAASAEIGVVLTVLTLATGMIWGEFAWGTWWVWDARLTSTALLVVLFLGYLAVRRLQGPREQRSKRAAIAGLIAFVDVPIVHFSVDWWRSLHQPATISRLDPQIDGLLLFTLMLGMVTFLLAYWWLMIHRFRVQLMESRLEEQGLDLALSARRAEADAVGPVKDTTGSVGATAAGVAR
jgi:heme exporter protein C